MSTESEPGVPEALPRLLDLLVRRLGPESVDRVWVFPPLVRGRRESGVVAVSSFEGEEDRRRVWTARYAAEETGRGIEFDASVEEEGSAPPDRLPRVMEGVVRRSGEDVESLGDAREFRIGGEPARWGELMEELGLGEWTLPEPVGAVESDSTELPPASAPPERGDG